MLLACWGVKAALPACACTDSYVGQAWSGEQLSLPGQAQSAVGRTKTSRLDAQDFQTQKGEGLGLLEWLSAGWAPQCHMKQLQLDDVWQMRCQDLSRTSAAAARLLVPCPGAATPSYARLQAVPKTDGFEQRCLLLGLRTPARIRAALECWLSRATLPQPTAAVSASAYLVGHHRQQVLPELLCHGGPICSSCSRAAQRFTPGMLQQALQTCPLLCGAVAMPSA